MNTFHKHNNFSNTNKWFSNHLSERAVMRMALSS